jgi:hypothetical protein
MTGLGTLDRQQRLRLVSCPPLRADRSRTRDPCGRATDRTPGKKPRETAVHLEQAAAYGDLVAIRGRFDDRRMHLIDSG